MISEPKRVVLAVTGASGSIYAWRTAKALLEAGYFLELILSPAAKMVCREELNLPPELSFEKHILGSLTTPVPREAVRVFGHSNIGGPTASGSHKTLGMVVVPCTMKTLAGIAHGYSANLIERSADVTLKENRPLILVTRETPMNLVQLKNQVAAAEAGAKIVPASPAFYQQPKTFEDLADFIAGRVLNLLGVDHQLFPSWEG
jgi:4-hydroxy-3-polyprenylbenzoate decarboxylase